MRAILLLTGALSGDNKASRAYFSIWLSNPGVYDVVATELSFSDGRQQNVRSAQCLAINRRL